MDKEPAPAVDIERSPLLSPASNDAKAIAMDDLSLDGGNGLTRRTLAGNQKSPDEEESGDDEQAPKSSVCCTLFGKQFAYGNDPSDLMPYTCKYYKDNKKAIRNEIVAGITVAFAQVGESVAFAFIAGVGPLWGLHAAWIVGICTALFGSRPGMIFGATGVRAAIIAPFVKKLGIGYVVYIVLAISIFQALFAITGIANLVSLVPRTVTIGFVNGLAFIYAFGQVINFRQGPKSDTPNEFLDSSTIGYMSILVAATGLSVVILPKLHRAFPPAMSGLLVATLLEHLVFRMGYGIETPTIGEVADVRGGFPRLFWEDPDLAPDMVSLNWEVIKECIQPAFIAAAAGAVECVLTMEVVNDKTRTSNDKPSQQLWALSLGNFLAGLFGTMGGGATIGVSVINVTNGANGRFRISGVVAAFTVLLFILSLSDLIKAIPTSALVGIMVVVVFQTFDWGSVPIVLTSMLPQSARRKLGIHRKVDRADAFTIVLVTVVTLVTDLFVAVVAGVLFTAANHAFRSASTIHVTSETNDKGHKVYTLKGPLFFASTGQFLKCFKPDYDPEFCEIHFDNDSAAVFDFSGIQALNELGEKYTRAGKKLKVRYLDTASHSRMTKADALITHYSYEKEPPEDDFRLEKPIHLHVVAANESAAFSGTK